MLRVFPAVAAAVLLLTGCGSDVPRSGDDDSAATGSPPSGEATPGETTPGETTPGAPTGEPTADPSDPGAPLDPTADPTDPGTPQPTPSGPEDPVPQPTTLPDVGELIGIPEPGVEAGCWLLQGYLLLDGDQELIASGRELQITGGVVQDVMTTCQQGTPYRVDTVVAIEPAG